MDLKRDVNMRYFEAGTPHVCCLPGRSLVLYLSISVKIIFDQCKTEERPWQTNLYYNKVRSYTRLLQFLASSGEIQTGGSRADLDGN